MNLFLKVVEQSSSGMLVESFLGNEELASTAPSCHLAMDLLCRGRIGSPQAGIFTVAEDCHVT